MDIKKINFKHKKYVLPLIALPFVFFFGYQGSQIIGSKEEKPKQEQLSDDLGETQDSILSKNDAYDIFYKKNEDRTMLDGLEKEEDSLNYYSNNLTDKQRRYIDSLQEERRNRMSNDNYNNNSYYKSNNSQKNDDKDYQRSVEMMRMLNNDANGNFNNNRNSNENLSSYSNKQKTEEQDPVKILRNQMIMMDSLEKSRDPKFQAQYQAEQNLKKNKEKMKAFLNSSITVKKAGMSSEFNSISKDKNDNFIKAVIDENMKGYIASRIRFRILEDIRAGNHLIPKGSFLYGQISGFTLQRVNINVVSVLSKGEILPINLSVFDIDGMQGLYIPQSTFREMMRELGSNSVQGTSLQNGSEGFFTSLGSKLFASASTTISNIIKQNKAKLKYNTYIYLINEKELNQNENNY